MKKILATASLLTASFITQAVENSTTRENAFFPQDLYSEGCLGLLNNGDKITVEELQSGFRLVFPRDFKLEAGEGMYCTIYGKFHVSEGTKLKVTSKPNLSFTSNAEGYVFMEQSYSAALTEYYSSYLEEGSIKDTLIVSEDNSEKAVSVGQSGCGQDLDYILTIDAENFSEGNQFIRFNMASSTVSTNEDNEYSVEFTDC